MLEIRGLTNILIDIWDLSHTFLALLDFPAKIFL